VSTRRKSTKVFNRTFLWIFDCNEILCAKNRLDAGARFWCIMNQDDFTYEKADNQEMLGRGNLANSSELLKDIP